MTSDLNNFFSDYKTHGILLSDAIALQSDMQDAYCLKDPTLRILVSKSNVFVGDVQKHSVVAELASKLGCSTDEASYIKSWIYHMEQDILTLAQEWGCTGVEVYSESSTIYPPHICFSAKITQ